MYMYMYLHMPVVDVIGGNINIMRVYSEAVTVRIRLQCTAVLQCILDNVVHYCTRVLVVPRALESIPSDNITNSCTLEINGLAI